SPPFVLWTHPTTPQLPTLSLHDALPISLVLHQTPERPRAEGALADMRVPVAPAAARRHRVVEVEQPEVAQPDRLVERPEHAVVRSEEHTSELQSRENLVCRLLLEKKNKT